MFLGQQQQQHPYQNVNITSLLTSQLVRHSRRRVRAWIASMLDTTMHVSLRTNRRRRWPNQLAWNYPRNCEQENANHQREKSAITRGIFV
jgi:hypothetical protein